MSVVVAAAILLLALVEKGTGRQDGYVLVQRNAMKAFRGEGDFRTLLTADPDIRAHLSAKEIDAQFDLTRALRHADVIIDRALAVEVRLPGVLP